MTAKCPGCGKEIMKAEKAFKNHMFQLESYTCPKCKNHFHVAH